MLTFVVGIDPEVVGLWVKIEKAVYDGLKSGNGGDQETSE